MGVLSAESGRFEAVVDVAIVGGGACGLTAALAARDAGAAPLVLEQAARCQGSSAMSLGALCAADTAAQRRAGIPDDAETFLADIMAKTGGAADPVAAGLMATRAGTVVDWLTERHDVVFEFDAGWRPAFGHSRARLHATAARTGADMMSRLADACDRAGVDVATEARVTDLFATADGTVRGVRVRRPDGSREDIGCGALVLASCGFGDNREMLARYIPAMREARYFGWEGNRGDAMLWGPALGGALKHMAAYQGLGLLAEPQGLDVNPKLLIEGGIQINSLGARFSNELDDVSGQGARVMRQPGGFSWVIYDERIHEACAGLHQYRALLALNARRSGDSVAALAAAIAVPEMGLDRTLAAVAAARETQDRFGRRFNTPILAPPYHALRVVGALFHTQGGLAIDTTARVTREDGSALPNLFAGGGAAVGVSGHGPSGYLPGAGLSAAITFGAIAGKHAATFK
jgi:fumarate reductase flavoprotein subunit